jgi:DNA topoisomerase IB
MATLSDVRKLSQALWERRYLEALGVKRRQSLAEMLQAEFYRRPVQYRFVESQHPRGQPENAGEFAPKEGGGKQLARVGNLAPARREGKGKEARLIMADGSAAPDHIKPSMVPPQWSDVHVSTDPHSDVLVRARDSKGRQKTVYSDRFSMANAAAKFARIVELIGKGDSIAAENRRNLSSADPKIREAAACLWLIQEQATRPGSNSDTKAKVKAYGATTLRAEHVLQDSDGSVRLDFIGKEGVHHNHRVQDPQLAAELIARRDSAGERGGKLFGMNDTGLRDYVATLGGGGFTPKDFRTLKATTMAIQEITARAGCCRDKKEYKAAVKEVATIVSGVLGNRPQQAVESYIDPTVWSAWRCPDCA